MKYFLLLLTILVCPYSISRSQTTLTTFERKELNMDGRVVRYRMATIKGESCNPAALVIYLHGGSGRGEDNQAQMRGHGIGAIYHFLVSNDINALMIVPQCPSECSWSGNEGADDMPFTPFVKRLIDHYTTQTGIDTTRIYLLGASMGGAGVWHMLNDYPGTFAAALAASGGARGSDRDALLDTPVYSTYGTEEGDRKINAMLSLTAWLNEHGGEARFEALEGLRHSQATQAAFTDNRLQWVFAHRKQ